MLAMKWILQVLAVTLLLMVALSDARGGRRGGSMGGIFGSWRKYKKPSSSGGSSRRIVSSSPVHTPITKALNEKKSVDKYGKNSKTFNSISHTMPPVPMGGSYYKTASSMPANAIYVAQAPPRGSEFGDYLTGYLMGRLLTMGMTPHHHVHHVYRDNPNYSPIAPEIPANQQNSASAEPPTSTQLPEGSTSEARVDGYFSTDMENLSSSTTEDSSNSTPIVTTTPTPSTTPPPYGIICMRIMVNETDASGVIAPVERIVCYPAPPPQIPMQSEMKSSPVEIAGDIIEH